MGKSKFDITDKIMDRIHGKDRGSNSTKNFTRNKPKSFVPDIARKLGLSKKGDTDPGNRYKRRRGQISNEMANCVEFLNKIIHNPPVNYKEVVNNFQYKDKLRTLVDHIIATTMAGWKKYPTKSGRVVLMSESGHFADPANWTLVDGRLTANGKSIPWQNVDKLVDLANCIDG